MNWKRILCLVFTAPAWLAVAICVMVPWLIINLVAYGFGGEW